MIWRRLTEVRPNGNYAKGGYRAHDARNGHIVAGAFAAP
jgi:hypothetical protein